MTGFSLCSGGGCLAAHVVAGIDERAYQNVGEQAVFGQGKLGLLMCQSGAPGS